MKLTAEKVEVIFLDCLFKDGEDTTNYIPVQGLTRRFGFHPGRLNSHREEIIELLNELPEPFMEKKGGGWTFLKACNTKDGELWGQHPNMEQLFCLGMGIGKVKCLTPREIWPYMPGGRPYYCVME